MTDTELVKILNKLIHLGDAPIGKDYGVIIDKQTLKDTLDLINRLKADIEERTDQFDRMSKVAHKLHSELVSLKVENERLESLCEKIGIANNAKLERIYVLEEDLETAKSEAYKEFAERLKKKSKRRTSDIYGARVFIGDIDNLLKEMGCK